MLLKKEKKKILLFEILMVLICKNLIPFTKGNFMPSLVEIDPMILEKKIFNYCERYFAFNFPW